MSSILNTIKRFLEREGWAYAETENGLRLNFGGKHGTWRCFARIRAAEGQFLFYSYAPVEIASNQYLAIAEFITRANFGLFIGNFELNFANGTLQFRTSIDVEGDENKLTPTLLKHLVYQNVLTMDKYLPGIQAVLAGEASAAEASQAL